MTELTRATAVALADGFDMIGTDTITDSTLQITPTEFGAQLTVTDLAKNQITKRTDLIRQAGRILVNSMQTKEDIDLLTQLDSFSVALGSAGTALTPGPAPSANASSCPTMCHLRLVRGRQPRLAQRFPDQIRHFGVVSSAMRVGAVLHDAEPLAGLP